METSTGAIWLYCMLGLVTAYWAYEKIKDNAFQSGYWKGRADGWRMATRQKELDDANNN